MSWMVERAAIGAVDQTNTATTHHGSPMESSTWLTE